MIIGGISLSASLCVGFRLRQALHCGAKGSPSSCRLELPKKRASAVQDLPHCPRDLSTWTPVVRPWGRKMECSGWPHVHPMIRSGSPQRTDLSVRKGWSPEEEGAGRKHRHPYRWLSDPPKSMVSSGKNRIAGRRPSFQTQLPLASPHLSFFNG